MKKSIIKLALVIASFMFAFTFAEKSISLGFSGATKISKPTKEGSVASLTDGGSTSTGSITFKSVVDNVTGVVKLENDGDTWGGTVFSSASVSVSDLFDGLLSLKFFDVGYGAGNGNSIRPGLGSHGILVTVKPIDMVNIGIGYGIAKTTFRNYATSTNTVSTNANAKYVIGNTPFVNSEQRDGTIYHALQLNVGIPNAFAPATVYFGAIMLDGATAPLDIKKNQDYSDIILTNADRLKLKEVGIYMMHAGFTVDALAFLKAGVLNLDVGVALPGVASRFIDADGAADAAFVEELNLIAQLHGSVSDLGVAGLGLSYYAHYALDTKTKQETLGDLDDDYFKELIKVKVSPSYTLGQFKFSEAIAFGMIGKNSATSDTGDSDNDDSDYSDAYNSFSSTTKVAWAPAAGTTLGLYYTFDNGNLSKKDDDAVSSHEIGLTYGINIGLSTE